MLKFHPNAKISEYEGKFDAHFIKNVYGKEILATELLKEIDIMISHYSSSLSDGIEMGVDTYQYVSKNSKDITGYETSKMFRFSNIEEFSSLVDSIGTPEYEKRFKDIRNSYFKIGGEAQRFKEAFNSLGIY